MKYTSKTLGIRLNKTERENLEIAAQGMPLSRYIKKVATGGKVKISRTTDPELLRQIVRIGNNINQISRALNVLKKMGEGIAPAEKIELANMLKRIELMVRSLEVKA